MTDAGPNMLGRYELIRRIAAGGMGEIYLARLRGAAGFEKRVVIKTILPALAAEPEFVERFLDEGRLVVQLTHGNIVPVFDLGDAQGRYFLAMEYIPGRDLRAVARAAIATGASPIPWAIAAHICAEIAKGLGYAHRKIGADGRPLGLVHRDVSPSNVLVSTEGEVKLIDFGIARAQSKFVETATGRIQGKFCYMSPEQACGLPVDARSDIFSTGTLLYELLTGRRPFEGANDLETLEIVRLAACAPPSDLIASLPPELDAVCARALARDPDDRFESADQMGAALARALHAAGRHPSGRDLQALLIELFPEGVEPPEVSNEPTPSISGPSDLDEAMALELARMGLGDEASADTRTATLAAPSEPLVDGPPAPSAPPDPEPTPASLTPRASLEVPGPRRGRARSWALRAAAVAAIGAAAWAAGRGQPGEAGVVQLRSEPAGASVAINGALVRGGAHPPQRRARAGLAPRRAQARGLRALLVPGARAPRPRERGPRGRRRARARARDRAADRDRARRRRALARRPARRPRPVRRALGSRRARRRPRGARPGLPPRALRAAPRPRRPRARRAVV